MRHRLDRDARASRPARRRRAPSRCCASPFTSTRSPAGARGERRPSSVLDASANEARRPPTARAAIRGVRRPRRRARRPRSRPRAPTSSWPGAALGAELAHLAEHEDGRARRQLGGGADRGAHRGGVGVVGVVDHATARAAEPQRRAGGRVGAGRRPSSPRGDRRARTPAGERARRRRPARRAREAAGDGAASPRPRRPALDSSHAELAAPQLARATRHVGGAVEREGQRAARRAASRATRRMRRRRPMATAGRRPERREERALLARDAVDRAEALGVRRRRSG